MTDRSTPILTSLVVVALILVPTLLLGGSCGNTASRLPNRRPDLHVAPSPTAAELGVAAYDVYKNPDSRHRVAVRLVDGSGDALGVVYIEGFQQATHTYLEMSSGPRHADTKAEGQFRLALLQAVIYDDSLHGALR